MFSFKAKLLISKLSLLVISLAALAYFQYSFLHSDREKEIHNTIESVLTGVENTVQSDIDGWKNLALSTTQTIEHEYAPKSIEQIIEQPKLKELFVATGIGIEEMAVLLKMYQSGFQTAHGIPVNALGIKMPSSIAL